MTAFSEEQLGAIDITRLGTDACVVAGPGSGKTTVLVERFHQLVAKGGVDPQEILAITFTEKAANNMKTRLAADAALKQQLETAYVSTVHGFCLRLIRENAIRAGVDPNVGILPESQGAMLQRRSLTEALDQMFAEQPAEMTKLMRSLSAPEIDLLGVYDAIRSSGIEIEALRDYPSPPCDAGVDRIHDLVSSVRHIVGGTLNQKTRLREFLEWGSQLQDCRGAAEFLAHYSRFSINLGGATPPVKLAVKGVRDQIEILSPQITTALHEPERATLIDILVRFEKLYAARKRERGMLDFSDLESYAVRLLREHPEVRAQIRSHFRQILMDEFQDTNLQQSKLLEQLRAPGRFYAVGDVNQAIFGFRHASPEVFTEYRDGVVQRGEHHAELVENWRSRPDILLATTLLLRDAEGVQPRALIAARKFPVKKSPSVDVLALTPPEGVDAFELEAQWIVHRINELRRDLRVKDPARPVEWKDIVILVRNSAVYEVFARVFERAGVPLELSRRKAFFETREARDLLHLLRTIANPRDEISTAAVLRSPFVSVSDEALLRLKSEGKNLGEALQQLPAGLDEGDRAKLDHFRAHLGRWREAQPYLSHDRLLLRAIEACAYPYDPLTPAGMNIEHFLKLGRESQSTLHEFLDELELLRDTDQAEPDASIETEPDAVRIMTVHSAKGLEFPVVFLAALQKGVDTGRAQFSFTPEFGLGAQWISSADSKFEPDSIFRANTESTKTKEKNEANRLFYVALTRAEEHLVLSYAKPERWGGMVHKLFVQPQCVPDGKAREVVVEKLRVNVICAAAPPLHEQLGFTFEPRPAALTIPRPRLTGQEDTAVTVTSIALFAKDPDQYLRERYAGWPGRRPRLADLDEEDDAADARPPASELGSQVHALLAGGAVDNPHPQAVRLADSFRAHELGLRCAHATRVEREYSFVIAIHDIVVRGQIDLWFEEQGQLILVDYKTDDIDATQAPARAADYAMQIHLYALVLRKITGRLPDGAYIHFLRTGTAVAIEPDPEAAERAVLALAEFQNSAWQGSSPNSER